MTTFDKWTATSEDALLETALVFENESSCKCGHSLKLAPLVEHLEKRATCPICNATVEVVCDGMVNTKEADKVVTFKYRKHLYRLSVVGDPYDKMQFPHSLGYWIWRQFLMLSGEEVSFTAQERIAQVLRMDLHGGMRVSRDNMNGWHGLFFRPSVLIM